MYSPSIDKLIKEICKLPGIGEKTAERLAFHMVLNQEESIKLSSAIQAMVKKTNHCEMCNNFAESTPCSICGDPQRDHSLLCVVEEPKDMFAIEKSGSYKGLYHILLGNFSPINKKGPDDIKLNGLKKRIIKEKIKEVILATNPTLEGDGTALFLSSLLSEYKIKISRIGRGVSWGLNISYANKASISDAISSRTHIENK